MAETGNPNSVSDAGVGALALYACIEGAWLNVTINAVDLKEDPKVEAILQDGASLVQKSGSIRDEILEMVNRAIDQ